MVTYHDEIDILGGPLSDQDLEARLICRRVMVPFDTIDNTHDGHLESLMRNALLIDAKSRLVEHELSVERRCNVLRPDKVACTVYDVRLQVPTEED